MNRLLTRLGVSPEIQAFFNVTADLSFSYGDQWEHYGDGFHKVPTTQNLWIAGGDYASQVIITYSAMEAVAFITLNRYRCARLDQLAFVAIGNRLHAEQADWIGKSFPGRKFTLVFGKDLLGHITDIKLTAGIKKIPISIFHAGHQVMIYRGEQLQVFNSEQLSLHAFQEAFSIRPRFRTAKPAQSSTFLDQLTYDAKR